MDQLATNLALKDVELGGTFVKHSIQPYNAVTKTPGEIESLVCHGEISTDIVAVPTGYTIPEKVDIKESSESSMWNSKALCKRYTLRIQSGSKENMIAYLEKVIMLEKQRLQLLEKDLETSQSQTTATDK